MSVSPPATEPSGVDHGTEQTPATETQLLRFPSGFRWGAATSAYQIEGAAAEDGRTASIWDTFSATPGKVRGGDTGETAADHYHRYPEDVRIMRELGLNAYRFSASWSRVQPGGRGPANPQGLAFYDRLVDELLAAGISPMLTCYHWDLPQELEDEGGWTARDTAFRFADFVAILGERLGDRVPAWTTVNEPWCQAFLGYASGDHAPGRTEPEGALRAAHHLLLGHGLGVQALRDVLPATAEVSIALNLGAVRPVSQSEADLAAVQRIDGLINRLFLEPIFRGGYPADVLENAAGFCSWDFVRDSDLMLISLPLDALGVNYYQPSLVGAGSPLPDPTKVARTSAWVGCDDVRFHRPPVPATGLDWAVDPSGLTEILLRVHDQYGPIPLLVTENGAAYPERADEHGFADDVERRDYLRDHLAACHEAVRRGVDLRGYFVWSLLDNFEWDFGYSARFGIVHVDYETQERTWKASARFYRDVIGRGGVGW